MKKIIASLVFVIPAVVSAQALTPITNVNNLSTRLLGIGNTIIYLLGSLAVVYIVWNVVQYFIHGESDKKEAGMNIIWGIVCLFVIVSIWGIVNILTNTFKTISTDQAITNLGNDINRVCIPANQIPFVE